LKMFVKCHPRTIEDVR